MAELPIMPVSTDALLADTSHMSAEEFGAYCRLLFVMWRHGGQLKLDPAELANIAGVPLKRWQAIQERVMRPMTVDGSAITQKKLTDTWDKVQKLRVKRASASNVRWSRKYGSNGIQKHMQMHSRSNANQNQISNNTFPGTTSERDEPPEGSGNGNDRKRPNEISAAELAAMYALKNTKAH